MRNILPIITVALLLTGWSATAAIPRTKAQETIESIGRKEPIKSSVWGVLAVKMSGDTVVCVNPRQKMVPASNMKLLTTGLALRMLGEDYRFETSLGYSGTIQDSTLVGDLYIIGGGDPTTGSGADCAEPLKDLFAKWMAIVRDAGINRIKGRIIGDARYFGCVDPESHGWTYEDMGTAYGVGPDGLNFYENMQNFYVTPGPAVGTRPFIRPRFPDTPWMQVGNTATTGKSNTTNDLFYVASEFGPFGEVRGHFPIDRKGYTLECSNRFGAYTCAFYFYRYLNGHGIPAEGFGDISRLGFIRTDLVYTDSVGTSAASASELKVIGSTQSAPLADIVKRTNKRSNNFFAETLLKAIGKKGMNSAIADSCRTVAERALVAMGLKVNGNCQYFDGSGLSRKNYVSPAFFVAFLRIMARSKVFGSFFDSLPVAGQEGTLEQRLNGSPKELKDRIHAKSGSMNGVRCISGYIESGDGNPDDMIVFSLMTNNTISTSWTAYLLIDDIMEAIALENE